MQQQINDKVIFELTILADPDRLSHIRSVVKSSVEALGCDYYLTQKIVLAVNEACMNIIQHAYNNNKNGEFQISLKQCDDKLYFTLTDNAEHIDLESVRARDLDDIRPGGLGLHFIKEVMDEFSIGHLDGEKGNYLEMMKRIN
jgi:anti-sigma regulatory factor (Ser/Thr protein kinase)